LSSGVDFTNIYTPSFCAHGFQKRKKTNALAAFFTLLDSARVKAVHRMLMKLSQGVNFINILCAHFLYKVLHTAFFYLHVTREKLPKILLYEKGSRKMLMKLTQDGTKRM